MLELGIKLLLSYLLGSLNGSLIIGKFIGVDIRSVGSGNAGGTNALRTQGARFAIGVMVIDIGKGFLPAWLFPALGLPGVPLDPEISRTWLMFACGAASVVGHCYPVWFNFRGGKGAATLIGMLIAAAPGLLLYGLLVSASIIVLTGFVGLATMAAVTALPIVLLIKGEPGSSPAVITLSLLALFIIYMHRSNIVRMIHGEENRMHKAMLFSRR
ncbi:MAG: glycerol-3-phosphate 1-O-acyltransferase PlsY [Gammaproteobacteria bacterium]|nr:acyl-phosphate glycerol 3-phosphate acyltransferase [Chromatiales bacterium]MDP6674521.1 glycerol-3-phosphate 1-O-acyltransferase PlsY [Gammaproteobacteria bacterium]